MSSQKKPPIVYTLTSLTCRESWPKPNKQWRWCWECRHGLDCGAVVERMTTAPDCPVHATAGDPPRRANGRVLYYRDGFGWEKSCLSRSLIDRYGYFTSDAAAVAWLLDDPALEDR